MQMGLYLSAERNSASALELLRSLNAANPSMAYYRSWLFQSLTVLARAQVHLGQHLRAESTMRELRGLLDRIGDESALDQFERSSLSDLEEARARFLAEHGRWHDAVPVLEANVRRREALVSQSPDSWPWLRDLIESQTALVATRERAGLISRSQATTLLRQLLADHEAKMGHLARQSFRVSRSEVLFQCAQLEAEAGGLHEAESTLRQAIGPLESESAARPERLNRKLVLARAMALRGELHRKGGRVPEALADARRAVELAEPTIVEGSGYLYELGAFQTAYREIAETTKAWTGSRPPELAECFKTLSSAVSAGFDNVHSLRADARLKLLRERASPEFERLVARAESAGRAAREETQSSTVRQSPPP
jgi:tetratricopeptide (TPR) repeat protein